MQLVAFPQCLPHADDTPCRQRRQQASLAPIRLFPLPHSHLLSGLMRLKPLSLLPLQLHRRLEEVMESLEVEEEDHLRDQRDQLTTLIGVTIITNRMIQSIHLPGAISSPTSFP